MKPAFRTLQLQLRGAAYHRRASLAVVLGVAVGGAAVTARCAMRPKYEPRIIYVPALACSVASSA